MMTTKMLDEYCALDPQSSSMLKKVMELKGLSARAYSRILKVARTIADLDSSQTIELKHVAEAIQYRTLDKDNWI